MSTRMGGSVQRVSLRALAVVCLVAAAGCGTKGVEQQATDTRHDAEPAATSPPASATVEPATRHEDTHVARQEPALRGSSNHVRLTNEKGCVQFEPHWTSIRVGQNLTWHSALKSPVTIHVSSGAFEKTEYVLRPGATASTGPARKSGSFSIWTEPVACQDIPRGVQTAGPGVMVEGDE